MNEYTFTTDNMIKYYSDFDPMIFKYNIDIEKSHKKHIDMFMGMLKKEESQQFSSLTKKDYAGEAANFDMVYDEKDKSKKHIQLLHLISDKIINQYINIDGIERLFSHSYIEFEWEMHFSADYDKHGMTFYRDHFIHQIRDAFMMHILLKEFDFYKYVKDILERDSESKVSRYVCKMIAQQKNIETDEMRDLREYDENFYIRNLIYMSSYMAGLFHDIGYPENYFMITNRHISNYIPELHNFNGTSGDFNRICSLLQNSLLFRVVPFGEILERLNNTKKPDHGALSALIFLLHFYENGAIYRMEPYKIAAIELAGLAIYNHTNKYEIIKKENKNTYRPCFSLNPISYILRICDDLQEWERIYFLISNSPSILLCNRCNTPIIRETVKGETAQTLYDYRCNCNGITKEEDKEQVGFRRAFDGEHKFHYRRLYNVSVCNDVTFYGDDNKIDVRLDYDLYKLLHASYINPDFSFYRISELNELKKLFIAQKNIPQIYLDYNVTANPLLIKAKILEEYLLKKGILVNEVSDICDADAEGTIRHIYEALESMCMDECNPLIKEMVYDKSMCYICKKCDDIMDELKVDIVNDCPSGCRIIELSSYLNRAMKLYVNLYLCMSIYKKNNSLRSSNDVVEKFLLDKCKELISDYAPYKNIASRGRYLELQCLIEDCFYQFCNMFESSAAFNLVDERYLKQFKAGECHNYVFGIKSKNESVHFYHNAQKSYVDQEKYVPFFDRKEILNAKMDEYVDAYTDLYIFKKMHEFSAEI